MKITTGQRRLILLLLAGSMAASAAFMVNKYLKEKTAEIEARYAAGGVEKIAVVVPKSDMLAGTKVTKSAYAIRRLPADVVPPDSVKPKDIERAEGQSLKIGLPTGRPLLWGYLSSGQKPSFSDMLEENRRALTIAVDELNSISGMIRPYDRIDLFIVGEDRLYGKTTKNGKEKAVMPLMQDVLVKATGNIVRRETGLDGKEYDRRYSTLTLDLPPEDIGRVLIAQENGALKAVLKRPEQGRAEYSLTHESDLWAQGEGDWDKNAVGIDAYIGGRGSGILEAKKLAIPGDDTVIAGDFAQEAAAPFSEAAQEVLSPEERRMEQQMHAVERQRMAQEATRTAGNATGASPQQIAASQIINAAKPTQGAR
ncbi:MAG: Flp pilus assembly protein CpaB [Zoogloeaceae bacterium]|jgi:pilus assembly protein CpaB|nr:Flp pilus assembly protein CpaB [Zoogloeaceae bacterium]